MKQNERILVYLVTGFLAVILVVAVFFGSDPKANTERIGDNPVRGLGEILDQEPVGTTSVGDDDDLVDDGGLGDAGDEGDAGNDGADGGDVDPGAVDPGAGVPLVASSPEVPAELLARYLGDSRRDRTVRLVRARAGDSLESLVRRWCGKRADYLDEARSLNEQLTVLRLGQEVALPWVDDEVILAAYRARQPRMLSQQPGVAPTVPAVFEPAGAGAGALPASASPAFQVPGGSAAGGSAAGDSAAGDRAGASPTATRTYKVKKGESYWKIAAKLYGAGKADRMIVEIRRLNPKAGDTVYPDQQLVVPLP